MKAKMRLVGDSTWLDIEANVDNPNRLKLELGGVEVIDWSRDSIEVVSDINNVLHLRLGDEEIELNVPHSERLSLNTEMADFPFHRMPGAQAGVDAASRHDRRPLLWALAAIVVIAAVGVSILALSPEPTDASPNLSDSENDWSVFSQSDKELMLAAFLVEIHDVWSVSTPGKTAGVAYEMCDIAGNSGSGLDLLAAFVTLGSTTGPLEMEMVGQMLYVASTIEFCPTARQRRIMTEANGMLAGAGS